MKIMVIDDELISRKKLVQILKPVAACIDDFERGDTALRYFEDALDKEEPYALVTIDMMMPYMDGLFVLQRIRDIERTRNIPEEKRAKAIIITASSDLDRIRSSIKSGCDDYILKPFNKDSILERLSKWKIHE